MRLPQLFRIDLCQPTLYRRLAQLHVPADLASPHCLGTDHLHHLQLEASVKDSAFGFRYVCCLADLHLSMGTKQSDQDSMPLRTGFTRSLEWICDFFPGQELRGEALRKERQDFVAGRHSRLARFVDQVRCHDAVRRCHMLREER